MQIYSLAVITCANVYVTNISVLFDYDLNINILKLQNGRILTPEKIPQ